MAQETDNPLTIVVIEVLSVHVSLQEHFGADRFEVLFAANVLEARALARSKKPRLVLLPVIPPNTLPAQSLAAVLPATCAVVGLVPGELPAGLMPGVSSWARQGDALGILSAVEAALGEQSASTGRSTAPTTDDAQDQLSEQSAPEPPPGPGAASPAPPGRASPEGSAVVADVDPARAADIRELGVSIRIGRTVSGEQATPSGPVPKLDLQAGSQREDLSQLDIKVGGSVTDALGFLPDPSQAVSQEERLAQVAAQRQKEAEAQQAQVAAERQKEVRAQPAQDVPTDQEQAPVPRAIFGTASPGRTSRKGLVIGLVCGAVVLGGGVTALVLLWGGRDAPQAPRAARQMVRDAGVDPAAAAEAAARKRGTLVDPYAGLIVRTPRSVRPADVDVTDEFLNRSVPELDQWFEHSLTRLSERKARQKLMERAAPLVRHEQHRRARRFLKRAVKIQDGADARALLAKSYEMEEKLKQALYHLNRAVELDPKRADLWVQLGKLYVKRGQRKKGCKAFQTAAKLDRLYRALTKLHCRRRKRKRGGK